MCKRVYDECASIIQFIGGHLQHRLVNLMDWVPREGPSVGNKKHVRGMGLRGHWAEFFQKLEAPIGESVIHQLWTKPAKTDVE